MADSYSYLKEIGSKRSEIKLKSKSPIHRIMEKWSKTAVNTMKKNTPKASGALAASISFKFGNEDGIITVDFLADDYWDYVNSGVDGFIRSADAIENKFGDTYSFKSEIPSRKMVDAFLGGDKRNWMASKGITSLTYGGETYQLITDEDYRGAAFVLARAVKRHGIQPSNFVASGINEKTIKQLEELLIEAMIKLF